jgi:glycosyltransferase involved in cell wall biosynthesis
MSKRYARRSMRVLHVVGGMALGGIETWLMHILRGIDREHFQMDFMVHTQSACAYDDEVRALGSRIIPCLAPNQPLRYATNFQRMLREHGPYDIIHSHVHHYSGYVLTLARQYGLPVRIAHSHNDSLLMQQSDSLPRQGYYTLMERAIRRNATIGLAASQRAARALYGPKWQRSPKWQIFYYGIDMQPFQTPPDGPALRRSLGLPEDAFVLGHVGRFVTQKNHSFLLEIAREVVRREPRTRLLLIGDGELRPAIEQQVTRLGLREHVVFAGLRQNSAALMRGVMDVFVLPSLHEGLPIVGIEAQAAGLPFVLSSDVPEELDINTALIHRLRLTQSAAEWAEAILATRLVAPGIDQARVLSLMQRSALNIQTSLRRLEQIYDQSLAAC